MTWEQAGELDKAISDYAEAIRLDPKQGLPYYSRGSAWLDKKQYDKAIADLDQAIRLNPTFASTYGDRGTAWAKKKAYGKAIADYSESIRLDPGDAKGYAQIAWINATCPDSRFRDGKKAIENATKACEMTEWKSLNYAGTLAAAFAEAGDFDAALKQEMKILELATGQVKAGCQIRIELHKLHKPLRDD
jgi:tetratricopeptide (TPR) repeat protein